jgi:hypothetical protein
VLAGFDFPIGLPASFARKAGIPTFPDFLSHWGEGRWADFGKPARIPEEISLERPFYPQSPGGSQRDSLTKGLGIAWPDLYRRCEQRHPGRRAACPLFWTLGGQQVGKAALSGWSEVLAPALRDIASGLAIWPFAGELATLCQPEAIIAAETYPAEFYATLDLSRGRWSKRRQVDRQHRAGKLLNWAEGHNIELTGGLLEAIRDGFGNAASGEDQFDAVVGLFGMLGSLYNGVDEPADDQIRSVEGWILGQRWNR